VLVRNSRGYINVLLFWIVWIEEKHVDRTCRGNLVTRARLGRCLARAKEGGHCCWFDTGVVVVVVLVGST